MLLLFVVLTLLLRLLRMAAGIQRRHWVVQAVEAETWAVQRTHCVVAVLLAAVQVQTQRSGFLRRDRLRDLSWWLK